MKAQSALLFALICSFSDFTEAYRQYTPEDVPNPLLHYSGCGRNEPSYVCDPSMYLSKTALDEVDRLLDDFKDNFNGPKACDSLVRPGYEVAVAIVPAMKFNRNYDKNYIAKEFAHKLFNLWGIGDYYCNNGVLLFLSLEDRVGYIATGTGAGHRLTSSRASLVITQTMRSHLRWGRYDDAVIVGLDKINQHLQGPIPTVSFFWPILFFLSFVGVIGTAIHFDAKQEREHIRMKKEVNKLETDRDALLKNQYDAETCPICLKELFFIEAIAVTDEDEDVIAETGFKKFKSDVYMFWSNVKRSLRKLWHSLSKKISEMTGNNNRRVNQTDQTFDHLHKQILKDDKNSYDYSNNAFGLPCGHIFCEKCIKPWLERKDTCPICKRSVIEKADTETPKQRAPRRGVHNLTTVERITTRREANLRARHLHDDLRWQALEFRARRLHWYYPRYVTRPMMNQFVTTPTRTYLSKHEHYVREQRRRVERRRANNSSNGSRSRSSFGGGRSSGGGGGSW